MSILLADEVAKELSLQSIHSLLWDWEADKSYHLKEDIEAEHYQELLFCYADVEWTFWVELAGAEKSLYLHVHGKLINNGGKKVLELY